MNRYWHFPLALLGLWAALFLVLHARSPIRWADARGWYAQQADQAPYRWTGNRLTLPLRPQAAPLELSLTLAGPRWTGRAIPHVTLVAGTRALASFDAPELPTTYQVVVPPGATALTLLSTVDRSPFGDGRYLGVQVFGVQAQARGFSWRVALEALVGMALLGLGALALAWCLARGYGAQAGLLALALLARLAGPWGLPGFGAAEAASLADALNLLANGRDRFGQLLALGPGGRTTPLLAYLELPLVALLGPLPLAGRVAWALAGALVAPVVYTCARRLRLPIAAALLAGLAAALPPAQVAASQQALALAGWAGCLLGGLWFVQRANRAAGLALALAAGAAWYADDALRLAVLLLVGWVVLLVLLRHGRSSFARWWPALAILALFWLPANYLALVDPGPATAQHAVAAVRAGGLPLWWPLPLLPVFGAAGAGAAPPGGVNGAQAGLLALGLGLAAWRLGLRGWFAPENAKRVRRSSPFDWWLLFGALLIAPLAASQAFVPAGALLLGPLLALLAGAGAAVIWWAIERGGAGRWRRAAQLAAMAALALLLCWQPAASLWRGAPAAASQEQTLLEASALAANYAAQADEIWVDAGGVAAPYLYVLAARALPPAESQALLAGRLASGAPDAVARLGKYRFASVAAAPHDLPLLEAVPDADGQSGFVLQRWDRGGRRILVLRRMSAAP